MRLLIYSLILLSLGFVGGLVAIQQIVLPSITFYANYDGDNEGSVTIRYKDLTNNWQEQEFDAILTIDLPDRAYRYGSKQCERISVQ